MVNRAKNRELKTEWSTELKTEWSTEVKTEWSTELKKHRSATHCTQDKQAKGQDVHTPIVIRKATVIHIDD